MSFLTVNQERVLGRVETAWGEDAAAREDRRARGLQDQPYDVARELGRSKYGTLLLMSRWEALGEAVAENQRLDEPQIQMAYDLLAIPKVLRNGSRQVPAADNAPALSALVERELARHRANLERSLNASDQSDRAMARLGVVKERGDSVTRGLKADLSRAERRLKWAEEVFQRVRQGVDPTTIIDPDTKAPIKPEAPTAPVSEPEPAAAESPPPTTPTSPESQTESPQRPLPKDCSEADEEMLRIVGEAIAESQRPSGGAQPPTDEKPGPSLALSETPKHSSVTPPPRQRCAPAAPFFADSPGHRTIDVTAGRAGWIDRARGSDSAVLVRVLCPGGPGRGIAATCAGPSADSFGPPPRQLVVQTDPAGTAGRRPFPGKTEKKEAKFSRKRDDMYGGPVCSNDSKTQNSMAQGTKSHRLLTARPERLLIENYALLTESASGLRDRLEEWYDYYEPTAPGECELMELAVMSSVQRRRVLGQLTELVNQNIRTADFDFDCAQEDEVERYRAMLETSPGAAILGLKRSALGIRLLIMRWERLERLLHRDGTWYGEIGPRRSTARGRARLLRRACRSRRRGT